MSIKVFTLTHKKFDVPPDEMYVPLQVGRALHEDLGYLGDNTGSNISKKNIYYSELTGLYWIWKNVKNLDYVGVCHYRRYLINEQEKIFTQKELEELLLTYDMIATRKVILPNPYYDGYAKTHHVENLDITARVIKELYPEYYEIYDATIHSDETYFGNIMICKKELFDAYATWLFSIFQEMEKYVNFDSYDEYHKRVYGFISEILLLVYVRKNKVSVYECRVGMLGEKVETKELKETLYKYLEEKDFRKAKAEFSQFLKRRPDVMMEASDISGELKIVMQIIATCELEEAKGREIVLQKVASKNELIQLFSTLNITIDAFRKHVNATKLDEMDILKDTRLSEYAIFISLKVMCAASESYEEISKEFITFIKVNQLYKNHKILQEICFPKKELGLN